MDTQAPTTAEFLEHVAEEGNLSPPATPTSNPELPRHATQFVAPSSSPLHASSKSFLGRNPHPGAIISRDHTEDTSTGADNVSNEKRNTRHLHRRQYGSERRSRKSLSSRNSTTDSTSAPNKKSGSWVERLRRSRYNPVMILENSGSTARDHLASERTFLAYVRTSLGLASMGVALVQLFAIADLTSQATGIGIADQSVQKFARPLGALTIALSIAVLLIGVWRYFKIQVSLPGGYFPIARISVIFTSFVFAAIIVTIFGAILSERS